MTRYYVTWEIDLFTNTPREAAQLALLIMRNPESIATVFRVCPEGTDDMIMIDLMDQEEEATS